VGTTPPPAPSTLRQRAQSRSSLTSSLAPPRLCAFLLVSRHLTFRLRPVHLPQHRLFRRPSLALNTLRYCHTARHSPVSLIRLNCPHAAGIQVCVRPGAPARPPNVFLGLGNAQGNHLLSVEITGHAVKAIDGHYAKRTQLCSIVSQYGDHSPSEILSLMIDVFPLTGASNMSCNSRHMACTSMRHGHQRTSARAHRRPQTLGWCPIPFPPTRAPEPKGAEQTAPHPNMVVILQSCRRTKKVYQNTKRAQEFKWSQI